MSDDVVRVSELDRRFVGGAITCVVGPVSGEASSLLPRLHAMFRHGADTRVGVIPDRDRTAWRRVEPNEAWIIDDPEFDQCDVAAAVRRLHARPSDPPIQVGIVERHLLVRVDHGVGDMGLIFEIVAALSQPGGPTRTGFVDPAPRFGMRLPVSRILYRQLLTDPAGTARAAVAVIGERLRRGTASNDSAAVVPGRIAEPYSVFVRSTDDYLVALTGARGRVAPRGSVSALLARAVAEEAAALHPRLADVHVVVSLRGRARGDRDTAGNLTAVVTVPVRPPADFPDRFDTLVRSAAVPVRLALSLGSSTVGRRADLPTESAPSVSVSNLTRASTSARIAWAEGSPSSRVCSVGAPLGDAGALAVVLSQVGSQVQATVHFDAAVYEPKRVERAVERALSSDRWAQ